MSDTVVLIVEIQNLWISCVFFFECWLQINQSTKTKVFPIEYHNWNQNRCAPCTNRQQKFHIFHKNRRFCKCCPKFIKFPFNANVYNNNDKFTFDWNENCCIEKLRRFRFIIQKYPQAIDTHISCRIKFGWCSLLILMCIYARNQYQRLSNEWILPYFWFLSCACFVFSFNFVRHFLTFIIEIETDYHLDSVFRVSKCQLNISYTRKRFRSLIVKSIISYSFHRMIPKLLSCHPEMFIRIHNGSKETITNIMW